MFQSFTGSSRRPRQVNLSGQNIDPFAPSAWTPDAAGAKKTVAAAQYERQQRQQERDRLNATKNIQRVWRGYKARKDLRDLRRSEWDSMVERNARECTARLAGLPDELGLLLAFLDTRSPEDIERLSGFSRRMLEEISGDNGAETILEIGSALQLQKLAECALDSLTNKKCDFHEVLLRLCMTVLWHCPQVMPAIVEKYYEAIRSLLGEGSGWEGSKELILDALRCPLTSRVGVSNSQSSLIKAYGAFAWLSLTTPFLSEHLDGLKTLAKIIDIDTLSQSIIATSSSFARSPEDGLWLLSHLIYLHRLNKGLSQESTYIKALCLLLSAAANNIIDRTTIEDDQTQDDDIDEGTAISKRQPLPRFIQDELKTLANKESVTRLLGTFNPSHISGSDTGYDGYASLFASYALNLLRIFPGLSEEIRMWLYQGSVLLQGSNVELPAIKLFWQAMSRTKSFSTICHDPKSALSILRQGINLRDSSGRTADVQDRDWSAILLFLELYSFVLRFTDDEEFLSGGAPNVLNPDQPISRSRASALPLHDVKLLTIFLKNLAFVMHFNGAELLEDGQHSSQNGLASYFSGDAQTDTSITSQSRSSSSDPYKQVSGFQEFFGISGMSFTYVRGMATRVMRMLYERDSRRRFLPRGHWLMTSRFDMEGFIPAVVMEEERRREAVEGDDEVAEEDEHTSPLQYNTSVGMGRARQTIFQENLRRQQQNAARKRLLAAIGPRLEILQSMPFVIPFETRVQIFRQFVLQDQIRRRSGYVDPDQWRMHIAHSATHQEHEASRELLGRHHAKIHRDRVLEDAYEQFYALGEGLKEPIQITFVDRFDTVEAGIDGGGVTKEFLTSITNEAFYTSSESGLFITNDQNLLYPNPAPLERAKQVLKEARFSESSLSWKESVSDILRHYEFLGRVIGKCLYEGILIDISFAGFFLLKWASTDGIGNNTQDSRYLSNINDLRDLDEALYQGLLKLKDYPGNVEDFALDFVITDTIPGNPPLTITRELCPNGANIPVTNENRILYISGVARHRLHGQSLLQTRAFLRGLGEIINPSWLSMFNQAELQTLLGGDSAPVDIDDLRRNTVYSGVYQIGDDGLEHPTIQIFWQVMKELDDSDCRKVLKYVTSTPRAPLLGFSQLNPRFSIRDAGSDEQRLPSTSTCINLLKLPRYSSAAVLRGKLLYAINSGAGFDLS